MTQTHPLSSPAGNPITPLVRLSYPNLFKPKGFEGSEPKYSCALIFDRQAQDTEHYKNLVKLAKQAAVDKWGEGKVPKGIRTPFRDGAERDADGYGPGVVFINTSSKQRPGIVGTQPHPETGKPMAIEDESEVYAGCYVIAELRAYAYDTRGNKGVAFGLQNLQKRAEGEMLGNRSRAEDAFGAAEPHSGGGVTGEDDSEGDFFG